MVKFRVLVRREQSKKNDHNPGCQEIRLWLLHGSAWKNTLAYSPGEKRGPGELIGIQGPPSPSSRKVHPDKQEIKYRQQEACMDEQELSAQEVKAGAGDPGGI